MGDFIKKWFHLLLIFVFAYLAGSLAGQANSRFRSVNGIPIYSASADGNWGLSFPQSRPISCWKYNKRLSKTI